MIKWRKVKLTGFEHYQISNDGILLNTKTDRLSIGHKSGNALRFELNNRDEHQKIFAHLLVLRHFKKSELDKTYGLHIDYNKHNNEVDNLEWATFGQVLSHVKRKKNELSKRRRGVYKYPHGKNGWRAALTLGNGKTKTLGYYPTKKEAEFYYKLNYEMLYGVAPY